MNEIYDKIIEVLKSKGLVFNGNYLNFIRLKISPFKMIVFDLDSGALYSTITNEIREKTITTTYYLAKNEPHPDITIQELKNLLKEIERT